MASQMNIELMANVVVGMMTTPAVGPVLFVTAPPWIWTCADDASIHGAEACVVKRTQDTSLIDVLEVPGVEEKYIDRPAALL